MKLFSYIILICFRNETNNAKMKFVALLLVTAVLTYVAAQPLVDGANEDELDRDSVRAAEDGEDQVEVSEDEASPRQKRHDAFAVFDGLVGLAVLDALVGPVEPERTCYQDPIHGYVCQCCDSHQCVYC